MIAGNYIINSMWKASAHRDFRIFMSSIRHARKIQDDYLLDLLKKNKDTVYGLECGFAGIGSVGQFRERIPIRTYDDYKPWIDRIIAGENGVLTSEPVTLLEPTGGSSGGLKLIPYTESLRREFLRGINTWVYDLFETYPQIKNGRSYWSISPAVKIPETIKSSIPIGFDEDINYLGSIGKQLRKVMVGDSDLRNVRDMNEFRFRTAVELLQAKNLAFISIWNPTFLTVLIDYMESNIESLCKNLSETDSDRAREIDSAFRGESEDKFNRIWPMLSVISCWTDSSAGLHAENLGAKFPGVTIQGKGLLATEGFITLPLTESGGRVLSFMSHYFEFVDTNNDVHLCDELTDGQRYRVIITTGGGLYRYDLGDIVEVDEFFDGLPVLTFIGRHKTVDMVGEKLSEEHVTRMISDAVMQAGSKCEFAMLSPERTSTGGVYVLYVANDNALNGFASQLRDVVEHGLKENIYYRHARDIGQLGPLKIYVVNSGASEKFIERCVNDGQKLGDIKPVSLDHRSGWSEWFNGSYLNECNASAI